MKGNSARPIIGIDVRSQHLCIMPYRTTNYSALNYSAALSIIVEIYRVNDLEFGN